MSGCGNIHVFAGANEERDCRGFIPELATPWRADAVVSDRLRVALDILGGLMGVTARRGK